MGRQSQKTLNMQAQSLADLIYRNAPRGQIVRSVRLYRNDGMTEAERNRPVQPVLSDEGALRLVTAIIAILSADYRRYGKQLLNKPDDNFARHELQCIDTYVMSRIFSRMVAGAFDPEEILQELRRNVFRANYKPIRLHDTNAKYKHTKLMERYNTDEEFRRAHCAKVRAAQHAKRARQRQEGTEETP